MNVLEAKGISKIFPGVKALDKVDVVFKPGEVHCIMGENGAGKSTLIKCLTGIYQPEEGTVFVNGKISDKKAFKRISYVPQEIDLFRDMTVAENLLIPYERSGVRGFVRKKELEQKAVPILEKMNISAEPRELVKNIPVSQQQLLQIARAISFQDYDVLMLDEPTTSLTTKDTENLYEIIRKLKLEGKAIIFISHKLEEIFKVGDCITVLCNGKKTAFSELNLVDIPWVVQKMTGRKIDGTENYKSENVREHVLLEVNNLTGEKFKNISFQLKSGEILGFAGLVGAGRSELMQGIFGYLPVYSGTVRWLNESWKLGDTKSAVQKGMFYLPEERRAQGILPDMSVKANSTINALEPISGLLGISSKKEVSLADSIVKAYQIKTADLDKHIKFLSGGNQQKVIIGRAMYSHPKVLIFDEPTKGIDIGTKTEIYKLMKRLAEEEHIGILLISSEMEELMKCANRIICMYQGHQKAEFENAMEREEVLQSILGLS